MTHRVNFIGVLLLLRSLPLLAFGAKNGEFLIDTNITYIPAEGKQFYHSVAFDGTNYFIVWADSRNGTDYDIYGARVNPAGILLDTAGIIISTDRCNQEYPSVAFDGTNYLIVWQDDRNKPGYDDIYGTRVTPSGEILDTAGIPISIGEDAKGFPRIAFDGVNYLVVWNQGGVYGTRVAKSGEVLDTSGFLIANGSFGMSPIAFDGTNYFVVYKRGNFYDDYLIYGTRVSSSGSVLDPDGILISSSKVRYGYPSVAFDGANYLVAWVRSWPQNILGVLVTPSGVLNGSEILISDGHNNNPSVVFNGTNYFVAWQDGNYDIYGTRVAPSGDVLDTAGIPILPTSYEEICPLCAFDGTNYLVVIWQIENYLNLDIYATRVNQSGNVLDTAWILISNEAYYQYSPSLAFDGTNYLAVWRDACDDVMNTYGTLINPSGEMITPERIFISDNPGISRVAFGGTNYLIAWQSGYKIVGNILNQSGVVLDTVAIPISIESSHGVPSIAFDGTNYLVVWEHVEYDSFGSYYNIHGVRVSSSGERVDTQEIAITNGFFYSSRAPSIAFDGTNYLVVWRKGGIRGARVSQSGKLLDTVEIIVSTVGDYPSLTFDGINYFVVWHDKENGSDYDIYGARVNQLGVVLDTTGIPISTAVDEQMYPSIAFDGTNYIVIWQDKRNGSWDIYGVEVSQSGSVINSFPVSNQPGNQIQPVLVRGTENQLLTTWSGWTPEINGKLANAMRIWGKLSPFGIEEDKNANCKIVKLHQNFPNPFSASTHIRYSLPADGYVELKIYSIAGQLVRTLVRGKEQAGVHTAIWDGRNERGNSVGSGIYFYQLKALDNIKKTRKMLLLR